MTKTRKRKKKESRRTGLEKILVPMDFSLAARKAFRYALDLAGQYDSKIVLLHVVEPSETDGAISVAKKKLTEFCKSEGLTSQRCTLLVRTGTPFYEITHFEDGDRADLIVLGRPALPSTKVGENHTLERVIRYANCPVLLVREKGRHFVPMPEHEIEYFPLQMENRSHAA